MLSRFLSEDPIGFDGGVNLYGYVSQSPVNAVDPSGRQEATVIGAEAGCTLGPWGCAAGAAAGGAVDLGLSAALTALFWKTVNDLRRNKPKQCPTNNCDDLLKQMYELMNKINGRIIEMLIDSDDLIHLAYSVPNPAATNGNATTWLGHVQQVKQKQRELQKLIVKALQQGCPIPGGAFELASRRIPNQPLPKEARKAL